MRSLFRIKVDKEEFLLHIFWHFNWRWPELQESFQPMSETIPTTQAHIIELKEQLPEAVKIDNIKVTPSEGRMKTPHRLPQNSSTVPMPKVMPPRKERKKRS